MRFNAFYIMLYRVISLNGEHLLLLCYFLWQNLRQKALPHGLAHYEVIASLQIETNHLIGSLPRLFHKYLSWWTCVARLPQY